MNLKRQVASFTLVEMLVSIAVFSLIVLLLFTLMSSATKLWRQQTGEEESYREARSALNALSHDMNGALTSTNAGWFYSNGTNQLAFLTTLPNTAQNTNVAPGDICAVGYSLEWSTNDASGYQTNMSLYRYISFSGSTYTNFLINANPVQNIFSSVDGVNTVRTLIARDIPQVSFASYTNNPLGVPAPCSDSATPVTTLTTNMLVNVGPHCRQRPDRCAIDDPGPVAEHEFSPDPTKRGIVQSPCPTSSAMKQPISNRQDKTSSALVITLLGVVLMTIIVVAFMQTMSLSLTTSKSYVDIRRATFAAQAGLDTAIAQISTATGTNLAFVTGLTNYVSGTTNYPVTLIGEGNLTNFDQIMPLVSGNITCLTNFGVSGFANNFNIYTAPVTSGTVGQTIDVNTSPYEFIEWTNGITSGINVYNASWVIMTNTVGSKVSYTRYAYVVLDDAARVNPALMTGSGTGYSNSTNWYTGPQDIHVTSLTNALGAQVLSSSQLGQITNSTTLSNSFAYSDATLGEAYFSSATYATNKIFLTSRLNPSFDVIPAWYPSGGMPKYNINDLATNVAYGTTGMARAAYIASIITNNLPNFYTRDPALTAAPDTSHFLYVNRLAANIVDYISPDYPKNVFYNSDYTYSTNTSGISPQGHGIYPISIFEQTYIPLGSAGDGTGTKYTSSKVVSQFWLSCWNPTTTPVTIQSANLHISSRPGFYLGSSTANSPPDYTNAVSVISGFNGTVGTPGGRDRP